MTLAVKVALNSNTTNRPQTNVTEKLKFASRRIENLLDKEKMLVAGLSLLPTMFSTAFYFRDVKSQDCVVKG